MRRVTMIDFLSQIFYERKVISNEKAQDLDVAFYAETTRFVFEAET